MLGYLKDRKLTRVLAAGGCRWCMPLVVVAGGCRWWLSLVVAAGGCRWNNAI
jgi:hypothetical protein